MDPHDFHTWLLNIQTILHSSPEKGAKVDPGRVDILQSHRDLTKMMLLAATSMIEGEHKARSWQKLSKTDIDDFKPKWRYDFREEMHVLWCIRNAIVHNDHDLAKKPVCLNRVQDFIDEMKNKKIRIPSTKIIVEPYIELNGTIVNFNNKAYDRFRFIFTLLVYCVTGRQSDLP